ncbi:MAG: glycine betaine/proline transport system substrate-binding protein [Candidatus Magnetoglobus multicellularis str. Araruama]|uniref:Glycine betaine/proline transport system substrate-binding protein n=1 Tax=Candidatus Magnetoglobus multicellularis str. Araruama TaxID=890399 RepID=A0A1V1P1G2_9BACT|nr:MAG: glycine betaine/proline transport system substrate-binding protein [Candidatus Magnetoglobus multicellularis str. Araruama]
MKNTLRFIGGFVSLILIFTVTTAYAGKKVKLAYVEWACATASTNVVKAVLQEKMGYQVNEMAVSAAAMWQATASGDVDGFVTAWLPNTHKSYLNAVKNKVEVAGTLFTGAKIGLVVPNYVTINSITELNAHAEKFDGKIIGIDPGAGLMSSTEKVVKVYGLNKMRLMEGSGAIMTASLANAYKRKQWVVVTGWSPHWKFARWSLKYLDDPKKIYGTEEVIQTIVRKDLKKEMPKVYAFLKNFKWPQGGLQTVMGWNTQDDADPYENAKRYIKENPKVVKGWLSK